ncbi:phage major capsid protein [Listeria booriae]|uniref:phage major capsid protein n=1 Tax=Listeria booriae TaxID=1552123 RepID=UPI00164E2458|nr:phage major capsid protein [Listeria booriae]MBC6150109.1 phage major capsid protein [Listeria booriae]
MAVAFNPDTVTMQDAKTGEIPFNSSEQIITDVKNGSALMKLAKAVPMTKPIEEFTYMSGVGAYWVNEAERIQTSKPTFIHAKMYAHKMGVIIPTTVENLKYSVTDFFSLMQAEIAEAFYKKFDEAGFTGTNSPYTQSILSAATAAGNTVDESGNKYDDINQAIALIEENDLDPNGLATIRKQRAKYRATKDNNGMPIFNSANSNNVDDILGLPIAYVPKDAFGSSEAVEYVGDWDKVYYGILSGIEFTVLTEATLTTVEDEDGNNINLAESDMAAIKATFSVGFMVAKDEAFSVVKPATAPSGN